MVLLRIAILSISNTSHDLAGRDLGRESRCLHLGSIRTDFFEYRPSNTMYYTNFGLHRLTTTFLLSRNRRAMFREEVRER